MTKGELLVIKAQAYAERTGEGAGYWLKLHLCDGKMLYGACHKPEQGIMRMEIYTEEGVDYAAPVWVDLGCVTHVQIDWS